MVLVLAACGNYGPTVVSADEVSQLEAGLLALGPEVDAGEAARAARIAFEYTAFLAREYEITDPPLVHNTKVNMGLRPRGLCWHWAEDLENRLLAEEFQTLDVLRAIANSESDWLIDHSTALLAPKGGVLEGAMVLDPWRFGGTLFWGTVPEDTRYAWVPQEVVHAKWRAEIRAGTRDAPPLGATLE
ncbi:MAG: hypothetical protein HKP37_01780 [Boseongicola sp.]|nr:hypothetical protein [Boseongicola sp.]